MLDKQKEAQIAMPEFCSPESAIKEVPGYLAVNP